MRNHLTVSSPHHGYNGGQAPPPIPKGTYVMNHRSLTLAGALIAAALPVAACTAPAATQPASQPTTQAARPSTATQTAPDSATGGNAPNLAASREIQATAEKYAQCLRDRGVDVIAIDGMILYAAEGGQATQVGSGQSPQQGAQGNPGPDEVECQRLVPEYQAPNFNER